MPAGAVIRHRGSGRRYSWEPVTAAKPAPPPGDTACVIMFREFAAPDTRPELPRPIPGTSALFGPRSVRRQFFAPCARRGQYAAPKPALRPDFDCATGASRRFPAACVWSWRGAETCFLRIRHRLAAMTSPLALIAELTHRCPLRCVYCSNPRELASRSEELPTGTWSRIFSEAARAGVMQLDLTGGEPLARPDLAALIAAGRAA